MPMPDTLPRILIIDHFDSYTLNLLTLLLPDNECGQADDDDVQPMASSQALAERVVVLPHTHELLQLDNFKKHVRPHIDALILSPGPGTPENPHDFGAADALLRDENLGLPVFGVCLGHQGLATAFGGRVTRARSVRHGLKTALSLEKADAPPGQASSGKHLLDGIEQGTQIIRYNSLTVDIDTLPECFQVTAWGFDEPCQAPPPHTRPGHDLVRSCFKHALQRPQSGSTTPRYSDQLTSGRSSPSEAVQWISSRIGRERSSDSSSLGELSDDIAQTSANDLDRVVLALEHRHLPLYGVQFHPESIESSSGRKMMQNFLAIARDYWRGRLEDGSLGAVEMRSRKEALDGKAVLSAELRAAGARCVADGKPASTVSLSNTAAVERLRIVCSRLEAPAFDFERAAPELFRRAFQHESGVGAVWLDSARRKDPHSRFSYMAVPSFALSYSAVTQHLSLFSTAGPSEAVHVPVTMGDAATDKAAPLWDFMDAMQSALKSITHIDDDGALPDDAADSIFRTGFVGYFGYEMKGESLGLDSAVPPSNKEDRPDCEFLFCDRVLAFDHHLRQWTAFALANADVELSSKSASPWPLSVVEDALEQSSQGAKSTTTIGVSKEEATQWFEKLSDTLRRMPQAAEAYQVPPPHSIKDALPPLVPRLSADEYMHQIELSREEIAAGESYELCMTTQFCGQMPALPAEAGAVNVDELDHFDLYRKLRARNPAPYSAFIRLPRLPSGGGEGAKNAPPQRGRSIVCTSPERFMRITRDGKVEMKPIKGTLARAGYGQNEEGMREGGGTPDEEEEKRQWREAGDARRRQRLAADVKERAENLMIVDLIRADLLSFCHAHSVVVPKLMSVESYETVHQLVTTVCGQLKDGVGTTEAIRRCFPPGSMTGAPKRRSVQLLERLERKPSSLNGDAGTTKSADRTASSSTAVEEGARRGIYSGALGWMGVDGAADFAVVIRTLVADGDDVSIGAGGAITYLSDPAKEWVEVLDKLRALANVQV